jgi:amino acid transporter
VRYAGRFVDPALEFCAGVNFFILQVALIPFEIVAFDVVLQFWTDKIPVAAVICILLLAYAYSSLLCAFEVDID